MNFWQLLQPHECVNSVSCLLSYFIDVFNFLQNVIGNNAKEVDEQQEEEADEQEPNHPQQLHMQQQMQKPDIPHHPQQHHNQPDEYDGDEMNRDNQVKIMALVLKLLQN